VTELMAHAVIAAELNSRDECAAIRNSFMRLRRAATTARALTSAWMFLSA